MTQGGDRVVPFQRPAVRGGAAVSGTVIFTNGQLRIPFMKAIHPPRWNVADGRALLANGEVVPIDLALVAVPLDEPGELGWLDRYDDRLAGELAVGADYERLIRHAAFSPVAFQLTLGFAADADGEVTALKVGLERQSSVGDDSGG